MALALAVCFPLAVAAFGQSAPMGVWKLNEAESRVAIGAQTNATVVYEAAGDEVKVTTDGVAGNGKPVHTEWVGRFDGREYPLSGDPLGDSRVYKSLDERTVMMEAKKDGKVVISARILISPDGKSCTVTLHSSDWTGRKLKSMLVYDRVERDKAEPGQAERGKTADATK